MIVADERWVEALTSAYTRTHPDAPALVDGTYAVTEFWKHVIRIVPGNRITTVPKDSRKDRPIAVEPGLNMMLQLGVDGFVRSRLKRWGINLDDQTKNQALAQLGSIDPSWVSPCTIDLRSASDTISLRACKLLLPDPWFRYLCDIRSPRGVLPNGKSLRYSKISSMGNGSTFAVESLIFAAITYGVSKAYGVGWDRELIAIYGDDIIVPRHLAVDTIHYLRMWGFSINREKTFIEGPIKESCGTDWFRGQLIRPVFLTRVPHYVSDLFSDRNRIFRWLEQRDVAEFLGPQLDDMYLKWIPKQFHTVVGPYSDTEFDTYWHTRLPPAPKGLDEKYRYKKLRAKLGLRNNEANDFLFRKLMAVLHPCGAIVEPFRAASSGGSVFDVPDKRSVRRGVTRGSTYFWVDSYKALNVSPPQGGRV
jgi:hypothetical protein